MNVRTKCKNPNKCPKPASSFWKQSLGVDWFNRGSSVSYGATLAAVLAKAATDGVTIPNNTRLSALDIFLNKRVADGSLALMDTLRIPALNDTNLSDFGRYNYKNPSANLATLEGANLYGLAGFTPNGVDTYVDTRFNPSTQGVNYTLNAATRGYWIYTAATVGTAVEGHVGATGNRSFNANSSNHRINTSANLTGGAGVVPFQGTGYRAIGRDDATNCRLFVGQTKTDRTATSTSINNANLVIGRSDTSFANAVFSLYYTGGILTDQMHNNIDVDFQAYLTAIGL